MGKRLTKYQVLLTDNPGVILKTYDSVNPGSLLPTGPITDHFCEQVIAHAYPLTPGTSAQKAEIIAFAQTLILGQGKKLNIYTDSKNTFMLMLQFGKKEDYSL
ncbi:Gag-Pol polyprotein, partial [Plecturocebus cupreus]